jgi:hypothetical protein
MINFFRIFNIFEKIKIYFIKIIKLVTSAVKKIFSSIFRCILKFAKNSQNIFNKIFKFRNSQIIKQIFNKLGNFQKKILKFLILTKQKNQIKSYFLKTTFNQHLSEFFKKSLEKNFNVKKFLFLSLDESIKKEKVEEHQNYLLNQEELSITRRIVENYLFWLQLKKQKKDLKIVQNYNLPKILDCVFDILQYLFILILQLIFLTISASLNLCCNIINDITSLIKEKFHTTDQSIPEKFEFESFNSLFSDSKIFTL